MIFVTGASGNVGSAVVDCLRVRQIPVRIGSRKLNSIPAHDGIETVHFDFQDASTYQSAVQGCKAIFLLRPPAIADTRSTLNLFVDVARSEGVQQIVFVSVAGAADNSLVPHHAVEQHLKQKTDWTILRPGFFAQNLGDAYRDDIVQDDRIFVPAGAGRVAFIDVRDLAEVAVNALTEPSLHQAQIYTLTGAEALTFTEVTSILSNEMGRTIVYQSATIPGYCSHLLRRRMPLAQVVVQTILHVGLRFGQAETVNDTLEKILGHRPRTMRDYVHDHRDLWLKVA